MALGKAPEMGCSARFAKRSANQRASRKGPWLGETWPVGSTATLSVGALADPKRRARHRRQRAAARVDGIGGSK